MSKAEENKRKKQEALFNTAFELFTTKGINNTAISDIVEKAGVAKGTFYLYFKDKYDIRDKLIVRKTSFLFMQAISRLRDSGMIDFEGQVLFVIDDVIEQLKKDKVLLRMISKDLSWGVYKKVLSKSLNDENQEELSYYHLFMQSANKQDFKFKDAEITLFLIIELVGSTAYNSILFEQPVQIDVLKPYLYESIRQIIRTGKA